MSLESSGLSIKLLELDGVSVELKELGSGFSKNDPAAAMRIAVEDFIASPKFKEFTESSCYNEMELKLEFLLHTTMPR